MSEHASVSLCVQCGVGVKVDEDGCCISCGGQAWGPEADKVLAELDSLRAQLAEARREVEEVRALLAPIEDAQHAKLKADWAKEKVRAENAESARDAAIQERDEVARKLRAVEGERGELRRQLDRAHSRLLTFDIMAENGDPHIPRQTDILPGIEAALRAGEEEKG